MTKHNTKPRKTLRVESLKHKDKRKNIPTEELRNFVREAEQKPKEVKFPGLLYARDPSLDPQLVWKGKDEQDKQPLAVPSVPIYIQEKIHSQAIIEDVRAEAKKKARGEWELRQRRQAEFDAAITRPVKFYHEAAEYFQKSAEENAGRNFLNHREGRTG